MNSRSSCSLRLSAPSALQSWPRRMLVGRTGTCIQMASAVIAPCLVKAASSHPVEIVEMSFSNASLFSTPTGPELAWQHATSLSSVCIKAKSFDQRQSLLIPSLCDCPIVYQTGHGPFERDSPARRSAAQLSPSQHLIAHLWKEQFRTTGVIRW